MKKTIEKQIEKSMTKRKYFGSLALVLFSQLMALSAAIMIPTMALLLTTSCTKKTVSKGEPSPTNLVSKYRNVIYTYTLGEVAYPEMYTHIIISFFKTDNEGNLMETSFPHTKDTVKEFKENHPTVKVMAALGGGSFSEFLTPIMMDPVKRKTLATQLGQFVKNYKLDGIDLDWEYYDDYTDANAAYLDFAKQLRKTMPKGTLLSMAGQKATEFYCDNSIVEMMKDVLDFTSVMTYDFDYNGRMTKRIAYNGNFTETKLTMQNYYEAGCPKEKLNTGLPFYGSKFKIKDDVIHYNGDPCHSYGGGTNYTSTTAALGKDGAANPMAYDDNDGVALSLKGHDLYVFDNETTLTNKVNWSCAENFGGVMEWVASDDDAYCTLQKAVTTALNNAE